MAAHRPALSVPRRLARDGHRRRLGPAGRRRRPVRWSTRRTASPWRPTSTASWWRRPSTCRCTRTSRRDRPRPVSSRASVRSPSTRSRCSRRTPGSSSRCSSVSTTSSTASCSGARYPTDQRGTPFRRFWDRGSGDDIDPIHTWLGGQRPRRARPGRPRRPDRPARPRRAAAPVPQRQPVRLALASAGSSPRTRRVPRGPADPRVRRGPRRRHHRSWGSTSARPSCSSGDGWFFVIQEQATEARFGFDELDGPGPPPDARLVVGGDLGAHRNRSRRLPADRRQPAGGTSLDDVRFVDHAAHLAALTHQQPMRVAIHAGGVPELVVP